MSIVLNRPINVFSINDKNKLFGSMQNYGNECQLKRTPISIIHKINHFSALIPLDLNVKLPSPLGSQFNKYLLKILKITIDKILFFNLNRKSNKIIFQ